MGTATDSPDSRSAILQNYLTSKLVEKKLNTREIMIAKIFTVGEDNSNKE